MTLRITPVLALLAIVLCTPVAAADLGRSAMQRHQLQVEQQRDALNLNLRQSLGARSDLSPADAQRLQQLQLQQRAEQQLLDQHQEQQLQRDIQTQRHTEVPSSPLQPPVGSPQLTLP
jgi:hypothetical protein